ncbi:MAG TPA: hypothetical protein VMS17_25205 [Gemmataceae bacterium]|nr:hypothetical protein [Gemmataceae bacterium]
MTPKLPPPLLRCSLLDLLYELRDANSSLTIGGGSGMHLKRERLEQTGERTLIDPPGWPAVRPTDDLDVILRAEIVADKNQFDAIADALDRLGYVAVPGAEYMQFLRTIRVGEQEAEVKVDLLVGPFEPFRRFVQVKPPRVRPKSRKKGRLHAHETPEAVGVDEEPLSLLVQGRRSTGEEYQALVCLPQAFSYALMKLFALRDRKDDPDPKKDKGRHHALDLYAVVAMTTEPEYDFARKARIRYADNDKVREAGQIVRGDFAGPESIGVLRLREHVLYDPAMDLKTFLDVLHEIFA